MKTPNNGVEEIIKSVGKVKGLNYFIDGINRLMVTPINDDNEITDAYFKVFYDNRRKNVKDIKGYMIRYRYKSFSSDIVDLLEDFDALADYLHNPLFLQIQNLKKSGLKWEKDLYSYYYIQYKFNKIFALIVYNTVQNIDNLTKDKNLEELCENLFEYDAKLAAIYKQTGMPTFNVLSESKIMTPIDVIWNEKQNKNTSLSEIIYKIVNIYKSFDNKNDAEEFLRKIYMIRPNCTLTESFILNEIGTNNIYKAVINSSIKAYDKNKEGLPTVNKKTVSLVRDFIAACIGVLPIETDTIGEMIKLKANLFVCKVSNNKNLNDYAIISSFPEYNSDVKMYLIKAIDQNSKVAKYDEEVFEISISKSDYEINYEELYKSSESKMAFISGIDSTNRLTESEFIAEKESLDKGFDNIALNYFKRKAKDKELYPLRKDSKMDVTLNIVRERNISLDTILQIKYQSTDKDELEPKKVKEIEIGTDEDELDTKEPEEDVETDTNKEELNPIEQYIEDRSNELAEKITKNGLNWE